MNPAEVDGDSMSALHLGKVCCRWHLTEDLY